MNSEKDESEPSCWSTLIKYRDRVSSNEFAKAARYRARHQLATAIRNLPIRELSTATVESYFVLVKLSLAYSAVEAVESLVGRNSVQVRDDEFHKALEDGQFDRLIKHLIIAAEAQSRPTDGELLAFCKATAPMDLRPLVKHARHVVFHASVTPSSLRLQSSPERRRLLLGLTNSTLEACERAFCRFVSRVQQRPKP